MRERRRRKKKKKEEEEDGEIGGIFKNMKNIDTI